MTVIHAEKLIVKYGYVLHNATLFIDDENGGIISHIAVSQGNKQQQQQQQQQQQDSLNKSIENDEMSGALVCAGFIDIHNHGIGGANTVEEYWLSDYSLENLVQYGTTSLLCSIFFPSDEKSKKIIAQVTDRLKVLCSVVRQGKTVVEGIHAEGPIIATCGGLPETKSDMSLEEFKLLVDSMMPALKVMTISPSLEKQVNYERMKYLLEKGVRPALGHDAEADEQSILASFHLAAEKKCQLHITHLYNVSSFHHRKQSLCNFGLSSRFPNLPDYKNIQTPTVELIGDTVHVHPLTLQLTIDYKSNDIALISDAIMDVHSKGVDYNNRKVEVCRNNHTNYAVLKGTSTIAGSCTNSLQIFHNIVRYINTPVEKAIMMLSENPARIANLTHLGTLEVGKRGDVLIFDNNYELQTTIIAGKVAWKRNK
jgi:N-acetylglucosamine-6-phosphate deacetylase